MIDKPTPKEIDDLVYELRQAGKDETYSLASAVLAKWGQPSGATEEVENLRKALVYAAFALHDTPQYMLAQGITLIDGDTVRVSRDGWTVEASVNPHRQPAPATQQAVAGEPFGYFHQLLNHKGKGNGVWLGAAERKVVEQAHTPGETSEEIVALYTTPQPTQPQAGAVPLTDEYPALVCDYCGALTPDPWHSSGMLHGKMSKHIHSCDACAARGAAIDTARKEGGAA